MNPTLGEIELDTTNNKKTSPNFITHIRPVVALPTDPMDQPKLTAPVPCGKGGSCLSVTNLKATCTDIEATGDIKLIGKWEGTSELRGNKHNIPCSPDSGEGISPLLFNTTCGSVNVAGLGAGELKLNFKLICTSQTKEGVSIIAGVSNDVKIQAP